MHNSVFMDGGGETGELARCKDWSLNPLGLPHTWPQSLKTAFNIILNSRFPMFLWWGPEMIMLYNDAYLPIAGSKHPLCFGGRGAEMWAEVWDEVGLLTESVLKKGASTWFENHLFYINRRGIIEETYFTFSHSPIQDDSGQINGVFCVCTETTQNVLSTRKVAESEKNLRNVVMKAPVGICIIQNDPPFADVTNDTFLEVVGKSRKEFEEKPFWSVLEETAEFYAPILKNVFTTGIGFHGKEHEVILNRNGKQETIFVDFVYEPIKEADNSVIGVMNLVINVTDKVEARISIEKANQQLEKSNADLKQFAYIASHDLQEPLRKLTNFTMMLEQSLHPVNEISQRYINKINAASTRMLNLIKDILTYSHLSKEIDVFEEVNLSKVMDEVMIDFELSIEQKSATINYDLPIIEAIPLQMFQLLNNLISNSLKYRQKTVNPVIEISYKHLTSEEVKEYQMLPSGIKYLQIQFRDNGIGFDQENANQIFVIFQRLHIKTEYSGTGIGLAMCKKIMENHHGYIFATSVRDCGSVFNIIIPEKQVSRTI